MGTYVTVSLSKGKEAIIDENMAPIIALSKWHYIQAANTGYARTCISRNVYVPMHRMIWESVHGLIPTHLTIDHINGNGCDNRLANLRLADARLQANNRTKRREGLTTSRYEGVTWSNPVQKWRSQIRIGSERYHLGVFEDELLAYEAYQGALHDYSNNGTLPLSRMTSPYKGVCWNKKSSKWQAQVWIHKKCYYLGLFSDELEAYQMSQSAMNTYRATGKLPGMEEL